MSFGIFEARGLYKVAGLLIHNDVDCTSVLGPEVLYDKGITCNSNSTEVTITVPIDALNMLTYYTGDQMLPYLMFYHIDYSMVTQLFH